MNSESAAADSSLPISPPPPIWRGLLIGGSQAAALLGGSAALAVAIALWPMIAGPIFLLAAGGAVVFLLHPVFTFALYYALSLRTAAIDLPGLPVSVNQVFFLVFFVSLARWAWTRRLARPRGWPFLATVALAGFYVVSALTGQSFSFGLNAAKTTITMFAIAVAVAAMAASPRVARQISWAVVLPTVFGGLVGAAEALLRRDIFGDAKDLFHGFFRINGLSPNAIVFAYTCLYAFPFGLFLARHSPRWIGRAAALGCALFLLVIPLATFNRQTWLFMPILVLLAIVMFRGALGRVLLVGALAAVLAFGPILGPPVVARFRNLKSFQTDWSFRQRQDYVINGLSVFHHFPWFGCGLGSYGPTWWQYHSPDTFMQQYAWMWEKYSPDLSYLRLLAETGAVGLALNLLYYAALTRFLWRRWRKLRAEGRRAEADLAAATLNTWALFLMGSAVQDTSLYLRTWMTFGLTLAFAVTRAGGAAVDRWGRAETNAP
ncbi:MAG: O-antigen ligase family protein [Candidatus Sumerlaeota bacterium]|nr:O-antigen ligase family protein [Candidatus Sumerlaeota bacterium]